MRWLLFNSPADTVGRTEVKQVAFAGFILALASGVIFTLFPELDLAVSALFQLENQVFSFNRSEFWRLIRTSFQVGFAVWYCIIILALYRSYSLRAPVFGFTAPKWFYLFLCSLAGPLILVNILLKDYWGRWRPREILDFGGENLFSTPLVIVGECPSNCSFVAGEVSATVMAFISVALISGGMRPVFYLLTIVMGSISGLIRIGQGAHFISDVLFAASFMVVIAAGIYWLLFLGRQPLAKEHEIDWSMIVKLHDRLLKRFCTAGLALLDRIAPRK
jgi:lipid A 4'-phosphatase